MSNSKAGLYLVLSAISLGASRVEAGREVELTGKEARHLLNQDPVPVQLKDEITTTATTGKAAKSTATEGSGTGGEPDPLTQEQIVAAIKQLDKDNNELWTNGNKPKTGALEELLGQPVSAAERDAAWDVVTSEQPETNSPEPAE